MRKLSQKERLIIATTMFGSLGSCFMAKPRGSKNKPGTRRGALLKIQKAQSTSKSWKIVFETFLQTENIKNLNREPFREINFFQKNAQCQNTIHIITLLFG